MLARRLGAVVAAMLLAGGCGTTVQLPASAPASVDDGLSVTTDGGSASGDRTTKTTPSAAAESPSVGLDSSGHGASGEATPTATRTKHRGSPSAAAEPGGPIKVGILLTTVGQASQLGLSVGNTYTERQFDDAVINAINHEGGLQGHRLVPVYAPTNTASSNWDADFQSACAAFTQDDHVDVVLGSDFAYEADFEQCLAKAGIPHLSNTSNVPDNQTLSAFPLLRALIVPPVDARSIEQVQGAISAGFLTPANKLGVVLDDCPGTQRAWSHAVLPFLSRHHIQVAGTADEGCASGFNSSFTSAAAAVSSAILRFRSKGVDRITFVTSSETGPLLTMQEEAATQGWTPGWIVNSLVGTATLQTQAPVAQMRHTRVYGWLPFEDVSPSDLPPPNAAQRRCVALVKSRGIRPTSAADYAYSYSICEAVFVYEAALAKAGTTTGTAVIHALDQLGTSVQSVVDLNGAANFSASRVNDAPAVYRELTFHDTCNCFRYVGPTYRMP